MSFITDNGQLLNELTKNMYNINDIFDLCNRHLNLIYFITFFITLYFANILTMRKCKIDKYYDSDDEGENDDSSDDESYQIETNDTSNDTSDDTSNDTNGDTTNEFVDTSDIEDSIKLSYDLQEDKIE